MKKIIAINIPHSFRQLTLRMTMISALAIYLSAYCAYPQNGTGAEVDKPYSGMNFNNNIIFLLEVDGKTDSMVDRTNQFRPIVYGGSIIKDSNFGSCLRFGEEDNNSITVTDGGKVNFDGGFTLETWIYLEEKGAPNAGGTLAGKMGSFWYSIKDNKLNNDWMVFPSEKIFTTSFMQYKYYPAESETFFGAMTIPANQWVHLAITYDQEMKVIRTWIDGGIDRTRYLWREGETPLLSDPAKAFEFMKGMKNFRVAGIRLSKGVRPIGAVPTIEAYVHQLPYENKVAIVLDHIDRKLKLPLDIAVLLEAPNGASKVVKRVLLDTYEKKIIAIDAPTWKGALHTLTVKAYAANQMVFLRTVRIANITPSGKIKINPDKSVSISNKKIYPLAIYHAFPEDYQELAEMGFNIIMPRGPSLGLMGIGGSSEKTMTDIRTCLDAAQKSHVDLIVEGNTVFGNLNRVQLFKDHPALLAWAGFDEPWGSLDKVQESYNIVKLLAPDSPVFVTQNNATRFAETAEGADILACDPYPLPNVSLRAVADATKAAVKAVAGLKPIWTILDQYEGKRPTLVELRCMAYLAIISGANGIGIYAWDDRLDKKTGWYTKEHPEDENVLRNLVKELKGIEQVLLIPNSNRKVVFTSKNSALHAAIKEAGGKKYLFIANDSRKEEEGALSLEGVTETKGVCLSPATGCSNIRIKAGKLSIKLPPHDAVIYEIQ